MAGDPDFSITTAELVGLELRSPDLYVYGGRAKLVDLREEKVIEGEVVDLSQPQRNAVGRKRYKSKDWLRGYCSEGLRLLTAQLEAVSRQVPLKLLHVAQDQDSARIAADLYNELAGYDIAVLVITDHPGSAKRLKQVRKDGRPKVIVTCQMVTEGFDCHELAVLVHATTKAASLFIAQVIARIMRITDHERAVGMMLPAMTLIPDDPDLRKVYASVVAAAVPHQVDDGQRCHKDHFGCPCAYPADDCTCRIGPPPPLRRYDVLEIEDPRLDGATVLGHEDGDVTVTELGYYIPECGKLGIPESYAPRVAVIARRGAPGFTKYSKPKAEGPTSRPASPGTCRTRTGRS